jgi:hypothetical protein
VVSRADGDQFHFDPATYLEKIREEVPAYDCRFLVLMLSEYRATARYSIVRKVGCRRCTRPTESSGGLPTAVAGRFER